MSSSNMISYIRTPVNIYVTPCSTVYQEATYQTFVQGFVNRCSMPEPGNPAMYFMFANNKRDCTYQSSASVTRILNNSLRITTTKAPKLACYNSKFSLNQVCITNQGNGFRGPGLDRTSERSGMANQAASKLSLHFDHVTGIIDSF